MWWFFLTSRVSRSDVPEPKGMRNDRRQSDTVHTLLMKHKSFSGPVGVASASATPVKGTVQLKKFNCIIHQIEMIADPNVVADLLYIPKPSDLCVNVAYTYVGSKHKVRFENCFDGKTIRWLVDGQEMPSFICESEDQYGVVGQGLMAVAKQYDSE